MISYVVTGASRGIGLEFVNQLSANEHNVVFALVRNLKTAPALLSLAASRNNIHTLETDVIDQASVERTAEAIRSIVGTVDVLINNAAWVGGFLSMTDYSKPGVQANLTNDLLDSFNVNVVGTINVTNAFLPLLKRGTLKKVVTLSSGMSDRNYALLTKIDIAAAYGISKAALNMAITKYSLIPELRKDGFIFVAIDPGMVDVSEHREGSSNVDHGIRRGSSGLLVKYPGIKEAQPEWDGSVSTPQKAVELMLQSVAQLQLDDSGHFISRKGDRETVLI